MKKVEHEYFIRVNSVNSCSFYNAMVKRNLKP